MSAELLKLDQVASLLGVSIHVVRAWVRRGALPSVRPARHRLVHRDDLNRFLRRNSLGVPAEVRWT